MALEAREAKRLIAGVYSRAAPTYDSFASSYFAHYAERLVARADGAFRDGFRRYFGCGTGTNLGRRGEPTRGLLLMRELTNHAAPDKVGSFSHSTSGNAPK